MCTSLFSALSRLTILCTPSPHLFEFAITALRAAKSISRDDETRLSEFELEIGGTCECMNLIGLIRSKKKKKKKKKAYYYYYYFRIHFKRFRVIRRRGRNVIN